MFEGSTMLAALAARTERLTLGLRGRQHHLPQPGAGGQDHDHPRHHLRRPRLARPRRRLVRGGARRLRVRLPAAEGALRAARGGVADLPVDVHKRDDHGLRQALPGQGAYNNPKPIRGDIPILIGGSGERKTLRLVAQYGDGCNLFVSGDPERAKHLLGVLEGHCADVGRDPSEITKTAMGQILVAPTHEAARGQETGAARAGNSGGTTRRVDRGRSRHDRRERPDARRCWH